MAKFIYKFEAIRKIKETIEKNKQKEVSYIDIGIEKKINEREKIINEEKESRKNFRKKSVSAGELQFIKGYEQSLKNKRIEILNDIEKLNKKRELKVIELVEKSKEHKIFNKLEEKYCEDFNEGEKHRELGRIDELATQNFVRRNK